MSARRRRPEEPENLERWLVSYADFITLLFAFFVVMYAISSVNDGKYRVLTDTLTEAFKTEATAPPPTASLGPEVQPKAAAVVSEQPPLLPSIYNNQGTPAAIDLLQRSARMNSLGEIADEFRQAFAPLMDEDLIRVDQDALWVELEINSSILFDSASAELAYQAEPVLRKVADILRKYPNFIQVEGFTDNVPISTYLYPSNWELASSRAASVVRLFEESQVDPDRLVAVGYGEYRPIADNASEQGRRRNRRVVVVILADDKARRALDIERNERGAAGAQSVRRDG